MDQAQGAQRLDQVQLATVERLERRVAREQRAELPRDRFSVAGQQHPQVLHGRAGGAVVEVDEVRAGIGPQHVAGMTVAVQPDRREAVGPRERGAHAVQCLVADRGPGRAQVGRHEVAGQQPVARLAAEALDVEHGPMHERRVRAGAVDAADEPADPLQHARLVELGRPSAASRVDREAEARVMEQRAAVTPQRRHDGDLERVELLCERVLLDDLRVAPSAGAVELGDHGRFVLQPDLVHTVLVAVQGEHAPVAQKADRLQRVEDALRREAGVGGGLRPFGVGRHWGMIAPASLPARRGVRA